VTVAVLSRPWGIRGELTAIPFSDHPERFEKLRRVYLFGDGRGPSEVEVESVRTVSKSLLMKFRGIDSMNDAEPWRGAEVRIPREERLALDEGEFFLSDLVGCEVVDRATGQPLGRVTGLSDGGPSGLLEIGGELLIPFVRRICVAIDTAARRIEVELPEGLKDLNRS
jgi:16S rRNA processing protein RimM